MHEWNSPEAADVVVLLRYDGYYLVDCSGDGL